MVQPPKYRTGAFPRRRRERFRKGGGDELADDRGVNGAGRGAACVDVAAVARRRAERASTDVGVGGRLERKAEAA
ncbi:MAG: hypothetical protein ACOZNI_22815 [Myxococcota bacterium]